MGRGRGTSRGVRIPIRNRRALLRCQWCRMLPCRRRLPSVRRGRGRRSAARLRAVTVNTGTSVEEDNTGLVVYRLLVAQVNPVNSHNDTATATGSGGEMVRCAAFFPRR